MIHLLQLLGGYIVFQASGGFPERFLNLCKLRGVDLRSLQVTGDTIKAITDIHSYKKLDDIAQRSGMTLEIIKERGLPFFVKRHRWRCGVAIGIAMVAVFIFFMSGFVWEIEVLGDDEKMVAEVENDLKRVGVFVGARKSSIDILEAQEEMLLIHEDINWISINIFGSKAQVEFTPVKEKLPITDKSEPMNVVATKKGKITLVECYSGVKAVEEGDYVLSGDLLISGVVADADGVEKLTHGSGRVYAYTENEYIFSSVEAEKLYLTEQVESSYGINLFGLSIHPWNAGLSDFGGESYINAYGNGTELPIGIIRGDSFSLYEENVVLTEHQQNLFLLCEAVEKKREDYDECELKSVTYRYEKTNDGQRLVFKIDCVENIAFEQPFYVEKN